MVEIKALVSFAGKISLSKGQEARVSDELAADLVSAGFAEKIEKPEENEEPAKKQRKAKK